MRTFILALLMMSIASLSFGEIRKTDQVKWKLFFNQMFALELHKEYINKPNGEKLWQDAVKKYTAYSPRKKSFASHFVEIASIDPAIANTDRSASKVSL